MSISEGRFRSCGGVNAAPRYRGAGGGDADDSFLTSYWGTSIAISSETVTNL
jgi:hypothetical protein